MKLTAIVNLEATFLVYLDEKLHILDSDAGPWPAISGPWGKGAAPKGVYEIAEPQAIKASEENKAYTDPDGFAWFAAMTPREPMERKGFGIHPDGNVPGTLGCIGVKGSTRELFDLLRATPKPITLYVV